MFSRMGASPRFIVARRSSAEGENACPASQTKDHATTCQGGNPIAVREQPPQDSAISPHVIEAIPGESFRRALEGGGDSLDLRAILTDFGNCLLTAITSPKLVPIYRAAVGDPRASIDSVKHFYEGGPRAVADSLADILRRAAVREKIYVDDYAIAADQFVGMVRSNIHLEVALGLRSAPSSEEIRYVVQQAVEIFLRGIEHPSPVSPAWSATTGTRRS